MKNKLIVLLAITFVSLVVKAQDYEIVNVEPDIINSGVTNVLTITFNKSVEPTDSVFIVGITCFNPDLGRYEIDWTSNLVCNDSIAVANLNVSKRINNDAWISVLMMDELGGIDSIVYDKQIPVVIGIGIVNPDICMVSVDSSNKNMIIWEPEYEECVDSIIIFKETAVTDEFVRIGAKSIEETSMFVDEESENSPNSNRYCIAFQDSLGVLSKMSAPHKTMHLTMNVGVNLAVNLIWEQYEGFDYSTFHIYRGSSKEQMMKIAEIAGNLFTFSDLNPSLFHLYYQVVIENPSPCNITQSKSAQDIFSSTKSNFVEYAVVPDALTENSAFSIFMYPNPVGDFLSVRIENSSVAEFDLEIHDLSGRSVLNYSSISNDSKIDLSALKAGMYIVTVKSDGINQNKIICKE